MRNRLAVLALALAALPAPALAQTDTEQAPAATPFQQRAAQLVAALKRVIAEEEYFAPSFLTAVPVAQLRGVTDSLTAQYGALLSVQAAKPQNAMSGNVELLFERAVVTVALTADTAPPHRVIGLQVVNVTARDDSPAKLDAEFAALPGTAGYTVARLDPTGPLIVREVGEKGPMAIGSGFKLWILAELQQQISTGKRKWSDVVPLAHKSVPSGISQAWPANSPVTMATLATLMISISDNTATDTLLFALGRDAVEERMAKIGLTDPARSLPMLGTAEVFAFKSPANDALRQRFEKASEAAQRDLLDSNAAALTADKVDAPSLAGRPAYIDTIEWFASGRDMAALLGSLDRTMDPTARAILAVNPGPANREAWRYLGYKGGSETGVIHMTFLACPKPATGKNAACYAVSGSWTNSNEAVDNAKFGALMARLMDQVAKL